MTNYFIYANLELPFYLKKGFLGEFCIKVDIFDGSITAQKNRLKGSEVD